LNLTKVKDPASVNINSLQVLDTENQLSYVIDAVKVIRKELDGRVPLIGFSGSPWTLATYMVEGSSSKEYGKIKGLMFDSPNVMHKLLDVLAKSVIDYLNAQIKAGAQAVMVFDTWGGILTPRDYQEFSLRYMSQIVAGLIKENQGRPVPSILFTKNGGSWLELMAKTGANALGVDWTLDLSEARRRVGDKVALQGNMDPCILYSSPDRIRQEVKQVLASYGNGNGHVFNLGHGIHPKIDPENVGAFIEAVHEFSAQYHK